jgi:hypothetical protein
MVRLPMVFNFRRVLGLIEFLDILLVISLDLVHLAVGISADQGWLPGVVARQIATMPLGSDMVELSEHSPTQQVNSVVV